MLEVIIDSIQDIKANDIKKLDLRKLDDAPCDYFVICDGSSNTQVKAIADNILKRVKDEIGFLPNHREGLQNALWICLDYFNIVIHIFYKETRGFYQIEGLWSDAEITEYTTA
ncbi:MAG TPA: ribosome silencing factor [Saprospiraceae bacterium]|nr:ribosome silencing factor [Saprospiraceae bacterium]